MVGEMQAPGTFAGPRLLGRLVRLVMAVIVFQLLFWPYIELWESYTRVREGWETPRGTWWFPVLLMFFLVPHALNLGLDLRLNWISQAAYPGLLVAAAALNFAFYGSLWGPVLGWFLIISGLLVFGQLTISFLVAAVAATPG